ncbi:TonB-dependent receptor [Ottowia thiooxydans]|uniref:TonB-dependent receptor n=1 Tax=Ottowia thiooxydans TaxID=219182 RepID=UPI00041BFF8B|nr:TonB-dependent receptor [Ottowia thiooxydans]
MHPRHLIRSQYLSPKPAAPSPLAHAALLLCLSASGLALPSIALAQPAQRAVSEVRYDIPAGSLDQALNRFATTAGIVLSVDGSLTAGKTSRGLAGSFGVHDGFSALLEGSGLEAIQGAGGGYVLRRSVAASKSSEATPRDSGVSTLQTVTVTARSESADSNPPPYSGGQLARGGRLGLLGNKDVMDTPFSIANYTSELIQNQQAATLADVLDNDPAVRMSSRGRNTSVGGGDNFFLRGFGLANRDISFNGLYGVLPYGSLSLETVERVEVLKGPSALLTGMAPSGGVGGAINVVPKRAADRPITRLTASYASNSQWGGHIDVGRRWGEDNQFGVRVNGVYRSGHTSTSGQSITLAAGAIGLDYRGDKLRASFDVGYQSDDAKAAAVGYRLAPTLSAIPLPPRAGERFAQSWERRSYKDDYYVAQAEYDVSPVWSFFGAAGARNHHHTNFRTESRILNPAGDTTTSPVNYPESSKSKSYLMGMRLKFGALNAQHELNIAASSMDIAAGYAFAQWQGFASNLHRPVFVENPFQTGAPFAGFLDTRQASETKLASVGISDTMSWQDGAVQLTLGMRRQKITVDNYAGTAPVNNWVSGYGKSVNSPAVGLVLKPWNNTSIYANYIQGLSAGATAPADAENAGQAFPPIKTKQTELGVKVDFGQVIGTIALFELRQPNAITVPGSAPNRYRYVMDGEQRNRGIEVSAFGQVVRGVRILGGVTYMQAKQVRTQGGANDGKSAIVAPRWISNAGVEWDTPFLPGLTLTARTLLTGSQYVNAQNTLKLPGWARWDLGARYLTRSFGRPLTIRANILNLANRSYWEGSAGSGGIVLSAPRTFSISATMDF